MEDSGVEVEDLEIDSSSEERGFRVEYNKIFVAVGKEVKESRSVLIWALQNSKGKIIYITYVHVPAQIISLPTGEFSPTKIGESQLKTFREKERSEMRGIIDGYHQICAQFRVEAENISIEANSIEEGIAELVSQNRIGRLVMGAAADVRYSRKMVEPKSEKANYVRHNAPDYCQISFVCKGQLIYTREGVKQPNPDAKERLSNTSESNQSAIGALTPDLSSILISDSSGNNGSSDELDQTSTASFSQSSIYSPEAQSFFSSPVSTFISRVYPKSRLELMALSQSPRRNHDSSPSSVPLAMLESDNSKREVLEESMKRRKAEMEAAEAICKAKWAERLYDEELRQKNELKEALAKGKEQLQKYREERDALLLEKEKNLHELAKGPSNSYVPVFFSQFSSSDLKRATNNFDPFLKVGEGGYGSIYKGFLRHIEVAIKILHPDGMQGPQEFQQEADVLSKLRHPNLVTLIGACQESHALIYEYLHGGSLEDRLNCKDNSSPLPWQTRIRIATELCSVLIFLHSIQPNSIIHGALKPSSVLLDINFVCKLTDFRLLSSGEKTARFFTTEPSETFSYMDPEFLATGEITAQSDVYSFGIILLRLLTGKPALRIAEKVEYALDNSNFNTILDPSAGDWPFVQAVQLARMSLRCCEMKRKNRPELASEVWRTLEPIKAACRSLTTTLRAGDDQAPCYFICPIFQEIMQDPQIAADGFTYEAEAIKAWLDGGHDTSPMTNMRLENRNLIPNRALRSAIQEWLPLNRVV